MRVRRETPLKESSLCVLLRHATLPETGGLRAHRARCDVASPAGP